jgi:hypothetical protein
MVHLKNGRAGVILVCPDIAVGMGLENITWPKSLIY